MNIPKNIEAYYQETGRAGRDGNAADAWMTYSLRDSVQQRNFIETSDAPDEQKRIWHQKLNALLGLCEAATCRRQILLHYFGDSAEPCGNCDNCLSPPKTFDATIDVQKALSCIYRTQQRFGVAHIIAVLRGGLNAKVRQYGHDKLSTFGIGQDVSQNAWRTLFRQLVALGFIHVDVENYNRLTITEKGFQFLREKQTIELPEYRKIEDTPTKKKLKKHNDNNNTSDDEKNLFEALRLKRLDIAQTQNIPPYVIFHDSVLWDLAKLRPDTLEAMRQISSPPYIKSR